MLGYLTWVCISHVAKKEWFSTYKPYDGGSVLMDIDVVCKTVGIDNICMRMLDGQVRTLTTVRHVPDLRKNFLSFGALEARGYKFSGANGGIKVTKDSMTILKGERIANLYKMTGIINVGGDASAATEKEDIIRL